MTKTIHIHGFGSLTARAHVTRSTRYDLVWGAHTLATIEGPIEVFAEGEWIPAAEILTAAELKHVQETFL